MNQGLFAVALLAASGSLAQTASFEVASVKPVAFPNPESFARYTASGGACNQVDPMIEGNRVTFQPATICGLIRVAYDVQAHQIARIPDSMLGMDPANYFEIVAQAEEGRALTLAQAREMLQALLAERFGLQLRRESGERPAYVLTVDRSGLKMSTEPMSNCVNGKPPASRMQGFGFGDCQPVYTIASLIENLLRFVDRPLVDRTGLTGKYSLSLVFTIRGINSQVPDAAPELPFALQEQLGLRMEAARVPVEVLAIEQVHRPTAN